MCGFSCGFPHIWFSFSVSFSVSSAKAGQLQIRAFSLRSAELLGGPSGLPAAVGGGRGTLPQPPTGRGRSRGEPAAPGRLPPLSCLA